MAKFHINEAGETKPCKATVKECVYGIHGDSKEEAQGIYEQRMSELEGNVEVSEVSMDYMDKYWDRSAGRHCEKCQAYGSHHTEKHDQFAKHVAFQESINCCGAPDCYERATCPNTTSVGHQMCGVCDDHGKPRHRCGCINSSVSTGEDEWEQNFQVRNAAFEAMTEAERKVYLDSLWEDTFGEEAKPKTEQEELREVSDKIFNKLLNSSNRSHEAILHIEADATPKEFNEAAAKVRAAARELGVEVKDEPKYIAEKHAMNMASAKYMDFEYAYRNVRKMPALFQIDREKHVGTEELNPKAAWIFNEPAKVTYKKDGTSITVDENGDAWARRSVRAGNAEPAGYMEAEYDPVTGNSFGLEPLESSPYRKFVKRAAGDDELLPGTYELCGPKVNGNPEGLENYRLLPHGEDEAVEMPDMRSVPQNEAYSRLKVIFADFKERGIEGVVWSNDRGDRVKLRTKDFFGDPLRK